MSEEVRTVKYDDGSYQQLMEDFKKLSTYEAVSEWVSLAKTGKRHKMA